MNANVAATLALLLLAPATGCIQGAALRAQDAAIAVGLSDPGETPARAVHRTAEQAAGDWNLSAQLFAILGPESARGHAEFERLNLTPDPDPGNGRAPGWVFLYATPAGSARAFVVNASREVQVHDFPAASEAESGERPVPLGEWRIDSDEAMAKARENATFAAAAGHDPANATFLNVLAADEDHGPVWVLAVLRERSFGVALVSADTGEVVEAGQFDTGSWLGNLPRAFPGGTSHEAHHAGRLSSANREAQHTFPVTFDGESARLSLSTRGILPTERILLEVRDPAGRVVQGVTYTSGFLAWRSTEWMDWGLAPGEYTITLTYDSPVPGIGADYALDVWVGTEAGETEWDSTGPLLPLAPRYLPVAAPPIAPS